MRSLVLLLAGCTTQSSLDPSATHFDPPSGTTLTDEAAGVDVVGLDDEVVCVTVDGADPGFGDSCVATLDAARHVPLACGFHAVSIRWGEGEAELEQASYLVEDTDCVAVDGPVTLWQNDELVRAFVAIKDDLTCRMNGCENPAGTGNWSTDCGEGTVEWKVSLDGFRAISEFTYSTCRARTTLTVHDPADPYWQDEAAVLPLEIELVLDGVLKQDTDFSGNGAEGGTLTISGDFVGKVKSAIVITDAARAGGWFEGGCASGPIPGEICAPGGAMIRYDYPDWTCHGAICPEPGDPPIESGTDTDGDGITDDLDVCPELFDPFQADGDGDGVGDLCDTVPAFSLIQFKTDGRCLVAESGGAVSSTTSCISTDASQQWEVLSVNGFTAYKSLATGACLSHTDSWIGPWTVVTAACDEADAFQQWDYEPYDQGGLDAAWPARLHATSDDFCAYTDFTGNVYGTIANCGLAGTESGRKVGVFPYGDFSAAPSAP